MQALMGFVAAGIAGMVARTTGAANSSGGGIPVSDADIFLMIGLLGFIFTLGPHGERKDEEAFEI